MQPAWKYADPLGAPARRTDDAAPTVGKRTLSEPDFDPQAVPPGSYASTLLRAPATPDTSPPVARGIPPVTLTDSNSAQRREPDEEVPAWAVQAKSALEGMGYTAMIIRAANVLNTAPNQGDAMPANGDDLHAILDAHGYDAIVNGAYYSPGEGLPLGSVMRDGELDNVGLSDKTERRGALAILSDGTMILDRTQGRNKEDLEARFAQPGRALMDVVAGGVMIIENGTKVTDESLAEQQTSLGNSQFRGRTQRTLLAIRDGVMFSIVEREIRDRTVNDIIDDLLSLEFDAALALDGSSGFHHITPAGGFPSRNPVSIGLKSWE